MKEFIKSKKGKVTIVVMVLLILFAIILGVIFGGSSEKEDKNPNNITIEQSKDDDKTELNDKDVNNQETPANSGDGLVVGESLKESEDTLSVSGEEDEVDDEVSSDQDSKEDVDTSDSDEKKQSTTQGETFGELY